MKITHFAFAFCKRMKRTKYSHLISLSFSHFKKLHSPSWTWRLFKKKKTKPHNTAHCSLGESDLLNRMVSHCPEGRTSLHCKPTCSSSFSWIGFDSPKLLFSSSLIIQLAAGPVQSLRNRHYPSLLVILNNIQHISYCNYAKRLIYIASSASEGTVSTNYLHVSHLCIIWLILQEEPPGERAGAAWFPTQHTGRAHPLSQAQQEFRTPTWSPPSPHQVLCWGGAWDVQSIKLVHCLLLMDCPQLCRD